jgi:hypothetical protein
MVTHDGYYARYYRSYPPFVNGLFPKRTKLPRSLSENSVVGPRASNFFVWQRRRSRRCLFYRRYSRMQPGQKRAARSQIEFSDRLLGAWHTARPACLLNASCRLQSCSAKKNATVLGINCHTFARRGVILYKNRLRKGSRDADIVGQGCLKRDVAMRCCWSWVLNESYTSNHCSYCNPAGGDVHRMSWAKPRRPLISKLTSTPSPHPGSLSEKWISYLCAVPKASRSLLSNVTSPSSCRAHHCGIKSSQSGLF